MVVTKWVGASSLSFVCCSGVAQLVYPLFNSLLLFVAECLRCLQVMVGRCYADMMVLERLLRSARLQFGMLPVGVDKSRIMAIYWRFMRQRRYLCSSVMRGLAVERLLRLRRKTEYRTLDRFLRHRGGEGWFGVDGEMGVLSA